MRKAATCILIGLSLLAVLFVSGCTITDHDHHRRDRHAERHPYPPHRGPHGPRPHFISATLTEPESDRGQLSLTMSDGEVYRGEYFIENWTAKGSLFDDADYRAYYNHFNVKEGTPYGRIVAYGDDGAEIQAECFLSGLTRSHGYGLAKDGQGQIFPITF